MSVAVPARAGLRPLELLFEAPGLANRPLGVPPDSDMKAATWDE